MIHGEHCETTSQQVNQLMVYLVKWLMPQSNDRMDKQKKRIQ